MLNLIIIPQNRKIIPSPLHGFSSYPYNLTFDLRNINPLFFFLYQFYKIRTKRAIFEMLYKSKSNQTLIKNKDLSLLHLTTLSNFLQSEQNVTQNITKEIKNQINLSKKNEKAIDKSIVKINNDAEDLVRRYEEEKEKNEKLEFLVKHIEGEIYKAKLDKASELKNNIETDKLEQYTNILKSKEKELEKICEKTNTSSYQLSKKLDSIRALRGERTIVSELLDKIERQLCNLEHCYKVLVIERTVGEKIYKDKIEDFNKLQFSANKELEKVTTQRPSKTDKEVEEVKVSIKPTIERTNSRPSCIGIIQQEFISSANQRFTTQSEFNKDKEKNKEKNARIENDIQRLEREKKVKMILNDLSVSSAKELPGSIEDLETENQSLLTQVTQLYQQILQAERAIHELAKKKKAKKPTKSGKKNHQIKLQEMKKVSESIKSDRLETREFKEICKILYDSIKQSEDDIITRPQFFNEQQEITFYMGFLEKYFQKSYLESKMEMNRNKKNGSASKRLTSLLNSHHFERNHMSIYEEKDLLDFAKRNLQRVQKAGKEDK